MKDLETLVLLDFDSIFYNKNEWKIINPKIGKVGSLKDIPWVLNFYRTNKNKENFNLFSYCIPIVGNIPTMKQSQIEIANFNLLPLNKLKEVFFNHKIRGRKIAFITLIPDTKILETLSYLLPDEVKEYLYQIEWISYWTEVNKEIQSYEFPQWIRFHYIKNLLKTKESTEKEKINQILLEKYKKIFYYTSDPTLIEILKKYVFENSHLFEYKTNTMIFYLIAKIV
ncbi:MAG: hypothetical protein ACK4UJ_10730 [Leptonema sp. (in: bacteria)]